MWMRLFRIMKRQLVWRIKIADFTDLAACQKRKNLILKAWGNLKKAIELDPSYAFAHYTIEVYLEQELFAAQMHFDTAIQFDPEDLYAKWHR